jgi:hypothetical protein
MKGVRKWSCPALQRASKRETPPDPGRGQQHAIPRQSAGALTHKPQPPALPLDGKVETDAVLEPQPAGGGSSSSRAPKEQHIFELLSVSRRRSSTARMRERKSEKKTLNTLIMFFFNPPFSFITQFPSGKRCWTTDKVGHQSRRTGPLSRATSNTTRDDSVTAPSTQAPPGSRHP